MISRSSVHDANIVLAKICQRGRLLGFRHVLAAFC